MIEDYLHLGIKKIELPSGKAIYSMDYETYKRYRLLSELEKMNKEQRIAKIKEVLKEYGEIKGNMFVYNSEAGVWKVLKNRIGGKKR